MPFCRDEARHKVAVTKHLLDIHTCPRCGKQGRGNGFGNHLLACERRQKADPKQNGR